MTDKRRERSSTLTVTLTMTLTCGGIVVDDAAVTPFRIRGDEVKRVIVDPTRVSRCLALVCVGVGVVVGVGERVVRWGGRRRADNQRRVHPVEHDGGSEMIQRGRGRSGIIGK
jgi:hypothetical protein